MKSHDGCPAELILGKVRGQWPIEAFISDAHAINWAETVTRGRAQLWRVTISNPIPLAIVPPGPARLTEVAQQDQAGEYGGSEAQCHPSESHPDWDSDTR